MFLSRREHIRHRRGGEGRAAEPGRAFVGSVFVAAHAPGTGSGRPAGCLVPCLHGGQRRDTALDTSQKGHCPPLLPDSLPPLCSQVFVSLSGGRRSWLPVEECGRPGPSRAPLSAWHRPRSAGTSLRSSLSWANTASPALQIPPSPPSLAELC